MTCPEALKARSAPRLRGSKSRRFRAQPVTLPNRQRKDDQMRPPTYLTSRNRGAESLCGGTERPGTVDFLDSVR